MEDFVVDGFQIWSLEKGWRVESVTAERLRLTALGNLGLLLIIGASEPIFLLGDTVLQADEEQQIPNQREPIVIESQTADDPSTPVTLSVANDGWSLTLKDQQEVTFSDQPPMERFSGLFVNEEGQVVSPYLVIGDVHKDFRPKPINDVELETGRLILWDAQQATQHRFAQSGVEYLLIHGEGIFVAIVLFNNQALIALSGATTNKFDLTCCGVSFGRDGEWLGVAIDKEHILADKRLDLQPDSYLPRQENEVRQESPAQILGRLRRNQTAYSMQIDHLLGLVEMPARRHLPPVVADIEPDYPLNLTQKASWQEIANSVETVEDVVTPVPFVSEAVSANDNTLALFERMGLIVPVTIDGGAYYRRVTESDFYTEKEAA